MRPLRLCLIGFFVVAAPLGFMLAIVLTPSFQTWAVRRFLEARPDWHTSVGSVAASFGSVSLTQLR